MRPRNFFSLGWILLGSAFLVWSAPEVWQALRVSKFGPILPYHTTNSYGVSLLQVQDASERLRGAFAGLPPGPVAVVMPEGSDEGIFLSYLIGYFAWPREVHAVAVTRANGVRELQTLERTPIAAIFFCRLEPPADLRPVVRIGSGLVMAPRKPNPWPNEP